MHLFVRRRRAAWCAGIVAALLGAALIAAGSASAVVYSWSVHMDGAQMVESHLPGDPDGSGTANITADTATNQVCSTVSWTNVAGPVVAGHIHHGERKQPEDPAFTVNLFGPNINGAPSGVSGCTILPGAVIGQMARFQQEFLVTIHNQQYPAGAIRGQLGVGNFLCELSKYTCIVPPPAS